MSRSTLRSRFARAYTAMFRSGRRHSAARLYARWCRHLGKLVRKQAS